MERITSAVIMKSECLALVNSTNKFSGLMENSDHSDQVEKELLEVKARLAQKEEENELLKKDNKIKQKRIVKLIRLLRKERADYATKKRKHDKMLRLFGKETLKIGDALTKLDETITDFESMATTAMSDTIIKEAIKYVDESSSEEESFDYLAPM